MLEFQKVKAGVGGWRRGGVTDTTPSIFTQPHRPAKKNSAAQSSPADKEKEELQSKMTSEITAEVLIQFPRQSERCKKSHSALAPVKATGTCHPKTQFQNPKSRKSRVNQCPNKREMNLKWIDCRKKKEKRNMTNQEQFV